MKYAEVGRVPRWVYSLRYIARSRIPLFGGLIKRGVWQEDAELARFIGEGWVVPDGTAGFRITESGLAAYARLARQYGIPD